MFVCFCCWILFCLLCFEKSFSGYSFPHQHLSFRCLRAGCHFAYAVSVSRQTSCWYNQYHYFFCSVNLSFALSIALYGVYHLPVFAFIGEKGIQNGICGLFVFTLFSRFALNLSVYLKSNYGYVVTSSNLRANVQGRGAITSAYVMAKILKAFAIYIFLGGVFMAIFNAFMPVIDISTPYQMVFLHKTLAEVMKH